MNVCVCVCVCLPELGVVNVFTRGNEAISGLPTGDMGVPISRMGDVPHLSCKMWVTSHPRVISLIFPPAHPKTAIILFSR